MCKARFIKPSYIAQCSIKMSMGMTSFRKGGSLRLVGAVGVPLHGWQPMASNNGGLGGFLPRAHRFLGFGDPWERFLPGKYARPVRRESVSAILSL